MDVDRLTVVVRPRGAWEAVDLGAALLRREWRGVLMSALPAGLLLTLLALALTLFWSVEAHLCVILLWWLKPLYDRLILLPLSRALFGEALSWAAWRAELAPLVLRSGLFAALTWRRFSLSRAFTLAVWQLEGAARWSRRSRAARLRVLRARATGTARAITLVAALLEVALLFGLVGLAFFLTPPMLGELTYEFWSAQSWPPVVRVIYVLCAALAIAIAEPLYVAGGFMLYLNRRIELEGWDIEIAFRRIAKRLAALGGGPAASTEGRLAA